MNLRKCTSAIGTFNHEFGTLFLGNFRPGTNKHGNKTALQAELQKRVIYYFLYHEFYRQIRRNLNRGY